MLVRAVRIHDFSDVTSAVAQRARHVFVVGVRTTANEYRNCADTCTLGAGTHRHQRLRLDGLGGREADEARGIALAKRFVVGSLQVEDFRLKTSVFSRSWARRAIRMAPSMFKPCPL